MLKPKEALEIIKKTTNIHISMDTVYSWIKNGKLPVKRLGGMVLIAPSDLDIFLSDFTQTNLKVSFDKVPQ